MKKIIFYLLSITFLIFFTNNKIQAAGQSCNCVPGIGQPGLPACVDTSPPGCSMGETCQCDAEIDAFSEEIIGCKPGICVLKPAPSPIPILPATKCNKACNNNCTSTCVGIPDEYSCKVQKVSGGIELCCCYPPRKFPGEISGTQPAPCKQGEPGEGIQTALGCIPTKDPAQFVGWLLGAAIKIAGGIAFLLIILGAIKILTSAGNPENVKAGQELITSALMGLLFIIFSLFLLELIGVKILNIPGFSKQ